MCGIVGVIGERWSTSEQLHAMCESIAYRGPDGEGLETDGHIGIGMRRLSIIDVAGGNQPMYNEDGHLAIVFNGEIYNYIELHNELVQLGHVFKTRCDTETVIHAYEEWGTDCLSRFNGMFAFALWDKSSGQVLIARDRLGKKPLYYRQDGNHFAFASEIRALKQIPGLSWTLDLTAIHHYLSLQYIPVPYSIYQEVHKLPAAHYLITDGKEITIKRYWDVSYEPKWTLSQEELRDQLKALVHDSVRLRLRSDVPLGLFLSGGLDSAVILAEMASQLNRPVEAFTISFDEEAFNEVEYAAQVAMMHHAHHHRFTVRLAPDTDPFMLAHCLDEPFANSSALPTFYLAQQTRQNVTVALSGDGSDEVFGGYQRYVLDSLVRPYELIPAMFRHQLATQVFDRFPVRQDIPTEANWRLGLKRLEQVAETSRTASVLRWGSYFNESMKRDLYTPDMDQATRQLNSMSILDDDFRRASAKNTLDRTLYTDLVNYLTDDGHFKVDRMCMANSLEVRNPYMDVRLVEFAARLSSHNKIAGFKQKKLLREAYASVLPSATVKRPKRGFAVPISQWFQGQLGTIAADVLLAPDSRTRPFFRPEAIQHLFDEHHRRQDDHGKRLWALLMLELWLRDH